MAIYQTSNIENGKPNGEKGTIIMTSNSGRPSKVQSYIYPGPQGRGIRKESVILKNHYQTTAKNPMPIQTRITTRRIK
jgi:hypothetical protein